MKASHFACARCGAADAAGTYGGDRCAYCNLGPRRELPLFLRDDLVRAVLAQQWAMAIALCDPVMALLDEAAIDWIGARRTAALPCAVDVVAEMLGEA